MKISFFFFFVSAMFSFFRVSASPKNETRRTLDTLSNCSSFMCGAKAYVVRYPFKFMNETRVECGYPGFDLGCNSGEHISLNLPNSGEFYVGGVNYETQEIQLQDPDGCLPGRLMKVLSNSSNSSPFSPFSGEYFKNYTFVKCPTDVIEALPFSPVISCLSNAIFSVTALSPSDLSSSSLFHFMCDVIGSVAVPVTGGLEVFDLSTTFTLSWKDPDCRSCEVKRGVCSGSATAGDTVCTSNDLSSSAWQRWQKFAKVVGFAIFLPLVILPFFFMFVLCCRGLLERERQRRNLLRLSVGGGVTLTEMVVQQPAVKPGLDDSVIESYPKFVLDKRQGNLLVDVMCCICLDEYVAGATVRWLPECEHYFHVKCIDKWLKVNRTCPVCRI